MNMILLIDNYDSFVFNLARYVGQLGYERIVLRNDAVTIDAIRDQIQPSHIILSPGPCTPNEAGMTLKVIESFYSSIPILGVCLGHQAICQAFGGKVVRAQKPMHGKSAPIHHHNMDIFSDIPSPLNVARYHSLVADTKTFPDDLHITAMSEEQEIMALRHREYPVFGVQFHPESIISECGYRLMENFLLDSRLRGNDRNTTQYTGLDDSPTTLDDRTPNLAPNRSQK